MNCLNCNSETDKFYCSTCGQKTSTTRFSVSHVLKHDLVHGIFHLDKGLFYTIEQLLSPPGHSIREYIQGKRVNHFNFFTLLVLLTTVSQVLYENSDIKMTYILKINDQHYVHFLEEITKKYSKLINVASIPFYASFSLLIFLKAKQTFSEHLVLNTYRISAELILTSLLYLIAIFYDDTEAITAMYDIFTYLIIIYHTWFFYQYFSDFYKNKMQLLILSILAAVTPVLLTILLDTILA